MQTTIHPAPHHQRVHKTRGSRQTSAAVIHAYVREEEERPLKNLQAASGDPGISPSHRADHLRLRDSSVGSPEKSDATGQTAGMHVSLDAGSMRKSEVTYH